MSGLSIERSSPEPYPNLAEEAFGHLSEENPFETFRPSSAGPPDSHGSSPISPSLSLTDVELKKITSPSPPPHLSLPVAKGEPQGFITAEELREMDPFYEDSAAADERRSSSPENEEVRWTTEAASDLPEAEAGHSRWPKKLQPRTNEFYAYMREHNDKSVAELKKDPRLRGSKEQQIRYAWQIAQAGTPPPGNAFSGQGQNARFDPPGDQWARRRVAKDVVPTHSVAALAHAGLGTRHAKRLLQPYIKKK